MSRDRVITLGEARRCTDCRVRGLCLPGAMPRHEVEQLQKLITQRPPLQRGDSLFESADRFSTLYAVRSGSLKGIDPSNTGRQEVSGFHLPGEILGFDAIADGWYRGGAVALETTSVCELSFDRVGALARESQPLQDRLIHLMSRELGARDSLNRILATATAQQKVAGFLLNLGARHALRGYSRTDFHLSMSRRDVASHLGLATATMSRVLTSFQQAGLITISRTAVSIVRPERLSALSEGSQSSQAVPTEQWQRR